MLASPPLLIRGAALAAALLGLAACPGPRAPAGTGQSVGGRSFTGCLPLPGTSRAALRLGPGGDYLYWTEQVRMHGYEDAWPSTEIVRWPLAGGAVEHLTNLMENPYRVLPDGRLVGIRKDAGVAVWAPWGAELVSLSGTIDHVELLAGGDAVVYREGSSIYRQTIHRQAAKWLTYADALLGVDGDGVFIRNEDQEGNHLYRVNGRTGEQKELPWLDDVVKAVPGALIVQTTEGIGVRAPESGGAAKVVLTGEDWKFAVGPDGVKAWRRSGPKLESALVGALVDGAGVDNLPPVLGGDSLEGFVRIPDGRVAYLVGQDLDGDGEVTTGDEVDVCLAARDTREVRVEPRSVPGRWRKAGDAIAKMVEERLGGGTFYFASGDAVPGLYIKAKAKRAGRPGAAKSRDTIWAEVRAIADTVATATGERTLFVDISYGDGKRGFSEWWSGAGRRVTWAGTGGATVPDLHDYDVTFRTEVLAEVEEGDDDGEGEGEEETGGSGALARCKGTVTNTSDHALVDLSADCVSGVEDDPIEVTPKTLAPGQTGTFDGLVRRADGANLAISIHAGSGRDEQAAFSDERHDRYVKLDDAAAEILDRTELVYKDSSADGGEVTVQLEAPAEFGTKWSGQSQDRAVGTAEEALSRLGGDVLGGARGDSIHLRITAGPKGEGGTWRFEEGRLSREEE